MCYGDCNSLVHIEQVARNSTELPIERTPERESEPEEPEELDGDKEETGHRPFIDIVLFRSSFLSKDSIKHVR